MPSSEGVAPAQHFRLPEVLDSCVSHTARACKRREALKIQLHRAKVAAGRTFAEIVAAMGGDEDRTWRM